MEEKTGNNGKREGIKRYLVWLPALFVMGMIFLFSSENGNASSELSGGFTQKVVEVVIEVTDSSLTPNEAKNITELLHTPIRKFGHLTEYAFLGMAVAFALLDREGIRKKGCLRAEAICVLYAMTDEIHQLFVPGRSGMAADVIIDGTGAFLGLLCFALLYKLIGKLPVDKKGKEY